MSGNQSTPIVLKLEDKVKIAGESLYAGYVGQIDVDSITHRLSMPMVSAKSSNSRTAGHCLHGDMVCRMRMNKAYPKLMEACAKGLNLGKAEIVMAKISESKVAVFAKYTLTDVYVSTVSMTPTEGQDATPTPASGQPANASLPSYEVALNYHSIAVEYTEYQPSGVAKGAVSCEPLTGLGA